VCVGVIAELQCVQRIRPLSGAGVLARASLPLLAMRRAAWRTQGVAVLRPEDIRDDWTRQALVNEANRLYGRRAGGGR
jgi:hypothetical protein